jgi:hypothetical protein
MLLYAAQTIFNKSQWEAAHVHLTSLILTADNAQLFVVEPLIASYECATKVVLMIISIVLLATYTSITYAGVYKIKNAIILRILIPGRCSIKEP